MAISEESRHRMYSRLQEIMGAEEAATLMAHLPPVGWADVATKRDLDHLGEVLRRSIDHLGEVMDARIVAEVSRAAADNRAALRSLFVGLLALQMTAAGLVVAVARFVGGG